MNARHRVAAAVASRRANTDTLAMEGKVTAKIREASKLLEQVKQKRRAAMDEVISLTRLTAEQSIGLPEEVLKVANLVGGADRGELTDDQRTELFDLVSHVVDALVEIQSQATTAIVALCVVDSLVPGAKPEGEEDARSVS